MATRIVTSHSNRAGKRKGATKAMTKKIRRKHKGYKMRSIIKGQMTYKRGAHKR